MSRSRRKLFILLVLFSFAESLKAQSPDSNPVSVSLKNTTSETATEKIFVHTDKSFYTAGEILWFKAYVLNSKTNRPLFRSKVAYVELLDQKATPVLQAKIALDNKGGDGSLQLPLALTSGYYQFRCYTSLLKNEGPGAFFEKQISVVNPLKSLEVPNTNSSSNYRLDLFPEGGNLVSGLLSRVAFKLSANNGRGVNGNGFLLDGKDTVLRFQTFKFGMGSFDFRPQAGRVYKVAFVTGNGNLVSKAVPEPLSKGYIMRVDDLDNRVKVTVRTNASDGYPEVFLEAQTRGEVKATQRSVVQDGIASFYLNKSDLGEGVSQLTVFDNAKKPVAERLFFVQPSKQNSTLNADKSVYPTRSLVSLFTGASSLTGTTSLAVYQLDSLQTPESINIENYAWLTSELKGEIEDPDYYFSSGSDEVKQAADNLMMTHGWRRFRPNAKNGNTDAQFTAESKGQLIAARVTEKQTNKPAQDVQVFLSIPTTPYKLYSARSNASGLVRFEVQDYRGAGDLILQTTAQKDSAYQIEVLSPFSTEYTEPLAADFILDKSMEKSLLNRSIEMQTRQIYWHDSLRKFLRPFVRDTFPYYGQAVYSYKLDDYTRFRTMEEVLREYVREINVGVKGSGASLRIKMFNEDERELYTNDILVTVDGVPLVNPNEIFTVDPLKIKKIDIIPRNYMMNNTIYHALANFVSYDGDFTSFEAAPGATVIGYEGLQFQREFYSPDYSTAELLQSRLPDLRSTLYWQPNLSTQNPSFYTGDNKGRFTAVLQGINSEGKTIVRTLTFEVK